MDKALFGFGAAGVVLVAAVAWIVTGGEKRAENNLSMHEPGQQPSAPVQTENFPTPNTQTMDEKELARVVAAGPQPGTFKAPTTPPPAATLPTAPVVAPEVSSDITRADLATHNTRDGCWVGFEGNVYDVTAFIPKHPGGDTAIAKQCGTAEQFEASFIAQHGREKVGMMMKVAPKMGALAK